MGGDLTIELSWPAKELWSNGSHGHWGPRHRAAQVAKEEAFWSTRQAMGATFGPDTINLPHDGDERIPIHLVAHPKTANSVDEQNLVSSLKNAFDGISLAIGIDDKFFKSPTVEWAEPVNGGRVLVRL